MEKYYVYLLLDPRKCYTPFYVGKGCGRRADSHLYNSKKIVNPFKTKVINAIRKANLEPVVMFWERDMSDEAARQLENELISKFGRRGVDQNGILTNFLAKGDGVSGHTPATRATISLKNTGKKRPHSEKTKSKLSLIAKNRSAEVVAKQIIRMKEEAEKRKGKPLSQDHKNKISSYERTPESNIKRSEKLKGRKISSGMSGKKHSPETIEKMKQKFLSRQTVRGDVVK